MSEAPFQGTEEMIPSAFAEAWPPVARRLMSSLVSGGLDPWTSEEITQEVACRVVEREVPFSSPRDLYPWAETVGRNLARDEGRRRRRVAFEPLSAVDAEPPSSTDVAREVEARFDLEALAEGYRRLSADQRRALAHQLGGPGPADRKEAARWDDLRRRARERLRRGLEGAAAFVALRTRLRRWAESAGTRLAEAVRVGEALTAYVVPALATAVLGAPHDASPVTGGTNGVVPAETVLVARIAGAPPPPAGNPPAPPTGERAGGGGRTAQPALRVATPSGDDLAETRTEPDDGPLRVCVSWEFTGSHCVQPPLPDLPPRPPSAGH